MTKNVKKKANAQKKKKILLLEKQVMGASIDEARANVKHISMDEIATLEKHNAIGPSGSAVCDGDTPGPIMKPSRRRRRLAWVLWLQEAQG